MTRWSVINRSDQQWDPFLLPGVPIFKDFRMIKIEIKKNFTVVGQLRSTQPQGIVDVDCDVRICVRVQANAEYMLNDARANQLVHLAPLIAPKIQRSTLTDVKSSVFRQRWRENTKSKPARLKLSDQDVHIACARSSVQRERCFIRLLSRQFVTSDSWSICVHDPFCGEETSQRKQNDFFS